MSSSALVLLDAGGGGAATAAEAAAAAALATPLRADALLRLLPPGAYTTARSLAGAAGVRGAAVLEFEAHVARTAASARLLRTAAVGDGGGGSGDSGDGGDGGGTDDAAGVATAEALRPRMARAMRLAAAALRGPLAAAGADAGADVKLTVLVLVGAAAVSAALAALPPHVSPLPAAGGEGAGDALAALAARRPRALLVAHAALLPPRRAPPIRVVARGAPRANAAAKDSAWVTARVALEAAKPADCEEVLLVAADADADADAGADAGSGGAGGGGGGGGGGSAGAGKGTVDGAGGGMCVLEGTQTNFFAVRGGTLLTAGDGLVLGGTVRRLVLEVCAREGVPVAHEAPSLSALRPDGAAASAAGGPAGADWDAAFLTSTSRLVLPIDEIEWRDAARGGGALRRTFAPSALVTRIERLVREAAAQHCSEVL